MRKNRTTEQKQTEQKQKGSRATAPLRAPAGPEDPPVRNDTGEAPAASSQVPAEAPATSSQMPVAGDTSCETTNTPDPPGEAGPAYKPATELAKGACLACGKRFRVPDILRRQNAHRGWPPQVRCHPCKLANDAYYAALAKTAPATALASDAKSRAASPAALVTSDGETPKMNWLLAAKGLLSANA